MFQVNNLTDNERVNEIDAMGAFHVIECEFADPTLDQLKTMYYAKEVGVPLKRINRKKQLLVELNGNSVTIQSGAMQWMIGNITSSTGVKGVGDLIGKAFASKVTKENAIKPVYSGEGLLMLEPTFKHILLIDVSEWGSIVMEDGMFYACDGSLDVGVSARKTLSSAAVGGEGMFNLCLTGKGFAALESSVPKDELYEFVLENDVLKIDGSMAIAWSNSLQFTVERSSKSLIGSAVNGEGLVNVYRGTGRVLMRPQ